MTTVCNLIKRKQKTFTPKFLFVYCDNNITIKKNVGLIFLVAVSHYNGERQHMCVFVQINALDVKKFQLSW